VPGLAFEFGVTQRQLDDLPTLANQTIIRAKLEGLVVAMAETNGQGTKYHRDDAECADEAGRTKQSHTDQMDHLVTEVNTDTDVRRSPRNRP